jgi:hypothetical protein
MKRVWSQQTLQGGLAVWPSPFLEGQPHATATYYVLGLNTTSGGSVSPRFDRLTDNPPGTFSRMNGAAKNSFSQETTPFYDAEKHRVYQLLRKS